MIVFPTLLLLIDPSSQLKKEGNYMVHSLVIFISVDVSLNPCFVIF